ncbi:hypothetical protein N7528_004421 [Penicillium herquei]|nr:hypothetical protein N7528_004421 [Penicillium herquei]
MRNRWAILIGVNFYRNPTNRLHGCVRDVRNIKASLEADSGDTNSPTEPEDVWPTPDRVKQTLEHVTLHAKEGDFVYFHYSGHGTQVLSNMIDSSTDGDQDFALALVDTTNNEGYFTGQELAQKIQLMVAKGLRVTVVLDCCFSGSVPRHGSPVGAVVRTVAPQDFTSSRDVCSSSALCETIPSRGARIVPRWLVNPKGYIILMACGPHERAYEIRVNGERRGALSHFLCRALSSLQKARTKISLKALFRNLCVHFHANFPQQTPMRYGNDEESFFSCLQFISSMNSLSIFRRKGDDQLCLTAGYAHGVEKGDEYILSPFHMQHDSSAMKDSDDHWQSSIRAMIDSVHGLTSELSLTERVSSLAKVKTGWIARPCSCLPSRRISVGLAPCISESHVWITAAEGKNFALVPSSSAEPASFLFSLENASGKEYQIMDGERNRISTIPAVSSIMPGAMGFVIDLLEHISTFKYIEGIENKHPHPMFESSFDISLSDMFGNDCSQEGSLQVTHGDTVKLTIRNHSTKTLYVSILDLCPSWKISNLTDDDGGGDYLIIPPSDVDAREKTIELSMEIPRWAQKAGIPQCEDVIKVFITDQPTSFSPLLLEGISEPKPAEQWTRYNRRSEASLSSFLSQLGTPSRAVRGSRESCWTTRNFILATRYQVGDSDS